MTALTADRTNNTTPTGAERHPRPAKVAAGVKIFKGAIIARDRAGFARPADNVIGWKVLGVAQEFVDNTNGSNGAVSVMYETGVVVAVKNDATVPVAQAHLHGVVYVKDDQTVQASASNGIVAGVAQSIEPNGDVLLFVATEISAATEELAGGVETVTTATALSLFAKFSLLAPTGTMAMTLGAGRFVGQEKVIRQIGGASTPISNVAGAFTTDGTATTSAAFNANADQLHVVWNGTAWQVISNVSVVLS